MADVKEISSLRISAEMDASNFVKGSQQVAAGNKAIAASSKEADAAVTMTQTKISQAGDVLSRLSRKYVDGYGAAQQFNSALNQLAGGMAKGQITAQQMGPILDGIYKKFGLIGDVATFSARGMTLLSGAMSELNAKLIQQQGLDAANTNGGFDTARLARMDELRTKFDTNFAAAQRLNAELNDLAEAERLGALNAQQLSVAMDSLILKHDAAAAAAARQATEYQKLALAGKQGLAADRFQGLMTAAQGVNLSGKSATESGAVFREADQLAARVQFLRDELDPAAAAQRRLNAELEEFNMLAAKGAIRAEELAGMQEMAQRRAANNTAQGGLQRFGGMNAGFQLQDIAMMSALGQSPLTVGLQQGPQLAMAITEGGGLGALKDGLMSLISPTMLLTVGLTTLTAVAIQFGAKLIPQIKTLKEATDDQRKAVSDLAAAYSEAGIKAEEFGKKSKPEALAGVRTTTTELQESAAQANIEALAHMTTQLPIGRGATGGAGPAVFVFKEFNDAIQMLNEGIRKGVPDYKEFEKMVEAHVVADPGLRERADQLETVGAAAAGAARDIEAAIKMLNRLNETRLEGLSDQRDLVRTVSARTVQESRQNEEFQANQQMARARTNAEKLAAIERQERAKFPSQADEGGGKQARVDRALAEERNRQAVEERDAADQRARALDRQIGAQQTDLALVGKTTAQIEGLRLAAQLEADVREQAAIKGTKADEAEIVRLRAKAMELGKLKALEQARTEIKSQQDEIELQRGALATTGEGTLARNASAAALKTEQEIRKLGIPLYGQEAEAMRKNTAELSALAEAQAKANLQSDLAFERRQMFRSPDEQQVGSRLQAAGLPDDLNSTAAAAIRANVELQHMKDTWQEIFDVANKGVDDVVDALFNGGKDIGEVLKGVGRDFAKTMLDLAVTNPLKNWLTGANLNSIGDLGLGPGASSGKGGGFGGILGNLLGAQKAVASMQVQAAIVNINGGVGGIGGIPGLGGLGGPNTPGTAANLLSGLGSSLGRQPGSAAVQKQVWDFFSSKGLAPHQIAGIMGNVGAESAFNPTAAGDYGKALGLFQWNDRSGSLLNSIGGRGNLGNVQSQLGFAWKELQTSENATLQRLMASTNVKEATSAFAGFERPRGWSVGNPEAADNFIGRLNGANDALAKFGGVTQEATSAIGTAASGLSQFGSLLSSFMAPGGGSGTGWFQNLSSLFGGATGAVNSMMSISPAATSMILAGGALGPAGLFHEGGIAGFGTSFRHGIDPRIFIGAPRYHNGGLAGDELPAILRRGEPVFRSMDHARQVVGNDNGNVTSMVNAIAKKLSLNVKNVNVMDPAIVGDYLRTDEGEKIVMNILRRNNLATA